MKGTKKHFFAVLAAVATLYSCSVPTETNNSCIVEDIPTIQAFLQDSVPAADIDRIVNAGVNAPSGLNRQPWHFSVITDSQIIGQMADAQKKAMETAMKNMSMPGPKPPVRKGPKSGLGDSPAVIVISCTEGNEFDAGLACECMNDMANVLGYGTKIVGSITVLLNGENKAEYYKMLQIPEGQTVVAAILLGKTDTAAYDAVSSATPRNPKEEVVTYVK